MTTRERWVVYPLLFLTLGIALRDKFLPPAHFGALDINVREIHAEKVRCNRLEAAQAECQLVTAGSPKGGGGVRLGVTAGSGGQLEVLGRNGKVLVLVGAEQGGGAGFVETLTADAVPLVQLRSSQSGGQVTTVGRDGQIEVITGHQGRSFGVFARLPGLPTPVLLTAPPWRLDVKPPAEKSSPDQPPAALEPPQWPGGAPKDEDCQ
jgi:hypothetical protein